MSMIGFPLLLIPLAICNIILFLMPGVSFVTPLVTLALMSGVAWPVTLSDVLIALGILLLLFEVIKGARPGSKYFMDHLLSLVVFAGAAAEFVMLPQFGTSTYFLLTMLALVDFLSGIALRTRRNARLAAVDAPVSRSGQQRDIEAPQPRFDPDPAPQVPPTTVAEAVLPDRSEPATPHPVDIVRTSSDTRSPGLQPNDGAHPASDAPLR
ncbi:hypothetical protein [uncultured Bradyrhizobium sp.]|uniref:hypothetical protein n=1 Tax=uncultured Bradyrhizobium sp. TaxID=199684 RepID=UPI0035C9DBE2